MKTLKISYFSIAAMMIILLGASCKKDNTATDNSSKVLTGVQLSTNAKFGTLLTDNNGFSLYFFSKDAASASNCVDACAILWPPFFKDNPSIGTGLSATDFAVITRPDGSKQNTYKGWPLYYYSKDAAAGDTNGDAFGNLWAIAKADYTVMFSNAQLTGLDGVQYTDQGVAGTGNSTFITDANGRTLYQFTHDTHNTNTFTKADLSNNTIWPMDEVATIGSIPTVLGDKNQFATITVFGKTQLVFKGHPVYYFGQDAGVRGSTKGVSFPTPGAAIWRVLNTNTAVL
jgi:predicted lipoprotein with Yx(FWY)xxD motif